MDEKILKILHDKLDEVFVKNDEIRKITSSIDVNTYSLDSQSLWLGILIGRLYNCLLYTSPSPRDGLLSRMPSSA